jgi:hypothetical protein
MSSLPFISSKDYYPALGPLKSDAMLAVSQAVCKAGAEHMDLPLYQHIAALANEKEPFSIPLPVVTVINGGAAASNELFLQDLMIAPQKCLDFEEALKLAAKITASLQDTLDAKGPGHTNVGSHAGFAMQCDTADEAFDAVLEVVKVQSSKFDCPPSFFFDSSVQRRSPCSMYLPLPYIQLIFLLHPSSSRSYLLSSGHGRRASRLNYVRCWSRTVHPNCGAC